MSKQPKRRRWSDLPRKSGATSVRFAARVWEALDTPLSLGCALRAKYGLWDELAEMRVSPGNYTHPAPFFLDNQAVKLVSKLDSLPTSFDREGVARSKFDEAEQSCQKVNHHFAARRRGIIHFPQRVNAVLYGASRKIERCLGELPMLSDLDFRFGPGAALGVRGETSVYNKVLSRLECTDAMLPILGAFLQEFPGWIPEGTSRLDLVQGSELTFVKKDATTARPICIEPLLNGLMQKGIGSYMRERLRYRGYNLRDQGVNQKLASIASTTELATVDFSSASDTIAYELVQDLLPEPWFELLDVARSPRYLVKGDGVWREFEKFSSMGNAYTFELETLIFGSIAEVCMQAVGIKPLPGVNMHVYGDDVIIPTAALDLFSEVTSLVGFSINRQKSFSQGPFRESCGTDWFLGLNVRPRLLKREILGLEDAYYAANITLDIRDRYLALRGDPETARRVSSGLGSVHSWLVGCIPKGFRFLIPRTCGEDGGLQAGFDVATPRRARDGADGWSYRCIQRRPIEIDVEIWPKAFALYHAGINSSVMDGPMIKRHRKVSGDYPWVCFDEASLFNQWVRAIERDLALSDGGLTNHNRLNWRLPRVQNDTRTKGYTVRGRTIPRKSGGVTHGPWVDGPIWPDRSIKLCKRQR